MNGNNSRDIENNENYRRKRHQVGKVKQREIRKTKAMKRMRESP